MEDSLRDLVFFPGVSTDTIWSILNYPELMCGRVVVDYDENMGGAAWQDIAQWIGHLPEGYSPSWNIKPTEKIPVAFTDSEGNRRFEYAYWSLIPPWERQLKTKYPTFNARAETAAEKPTFKAAVKHTRCIIPVTGFYEWTGTRGTRIPHAIVGPSTILPMAGLYSWWHDPAAPEDSGWYLTATILTCKSSGVMESLHDRMPVFMTPALAWEWLDPATVGDQSLVNAVADAAVPISEGLRQWPVLPLRGDGPELMQPAPVLPIEVESP